MNRIADHDRRYVFVCGVHRSGTSVLTRNIGKFQDCTSFTNTGAIEDEGQYLQEVYPPDIVYGGTGRYGFDSRAHLTEASPLLTAENIRRLRESWHLYWDPVKPICVEKTPGNLIITRFLQAAFPNAYFIVIRRHPVPVSLATQGWKVSKTSLHRLFDHWLWCHRMYEEDRPHLRRVYEVNYEEYIKCPSKFHCEIASFIGTSPEIDSTEGLTASHNDKYFNRWAALLNESAFKAYYRTIVPKYEGQFAKYGYSLTRTPDGTVLLKGRSQRFAALGCIYFATADVSALLLRSVLQFRWFVKRQLRARLRDSVKISLKRLLYRKPTGETP